MTDMSSLVSMSEINQLHKLVRNDSLLKLFRTKQKLGLTSCEIYKMILLKTRQNVCIRFCLTVFYFNSTNKIGKCHH